MKEDNDVSSAPLLFVRCFFCGVQVDAMVRRGRIKVDGKVVRSPKTKLPVNCVIEVGHQRQRPG